MPETPETEDLRANQEQHASRRQRKPFPGGLEQRGDRSRQADEQKRQHLSELATALSG
jgi:hypothetical protein